MPAGFESTEGFEANEAAVSAPEIPNPFYEQVPES